MGSGSPTKSSEMSSEYRRLSSRPAYTELLEGTPQQRPIAGLSDLQAFQRERFALAVERGRRASKPSKEVHWHAVLSMRCATAPAASRANVSERAVHGVSETTAMMELAIERTPETAAHGRAGGAVCAVGGRRDGASSGTPARCSSTAARSRYRQSRHA